jgi:hypothetical protein
VRPDLDGDGGGPAEIARRVILNDIGPSLEIDGLMKIKGYIANPPPRKTWDEAAHG